MTSAHLTLEEALIFAAKNSEIDYDFSPCLSDDGNFIKPNVKAYHLFWPEDPEDFIGAMRIDMPLPELKTSSSFFALYQEFRSLFANDTFQLMGCLDSPVNELKEIASSVANYLHPNNEDWSELVIVSESNDVVERRVVYGYYFKKSAIDAQVETVLKRGGRPSTYDWERIAEILQGERDNDGLIFKSQKELFVHISGLCEKLSNQSPETQTIKNGLNKIDPKLIDSLIDR